MENQPALEPVPDVAPAPKNKRLFIAAIAVFGVVLVFVLITILTGSSSKNTQNITTGTRQQGAGNPNQQNVENSGQPLPSTSKPVDNWKTYQNANYIINYPPDWTIQELNLTGGTRGVNIKPVADLGNISNINFTVSVDTSSVVDKFKQKQEMYAQMGFKSSSILLDNTAATRLSGTIPQRSVKVPATAKILQTSYIYLAKGNNGYFLDYSYLSVNSDIQLENIFNKMLTSFKILQ